MTVSRRKMIAGTAATAVALAVTSTAVAEASELPSLIAGHRAAWERLEAACDGSWQAEEQYKAVATLRTARVHSRLSLTVREQGRTAIWYELREEAREEFAKEFDRMRRAVLTDLSATVRAQSFAEIDALQRAAYRNLAATIREIKAEQEATGFTEAWDEQGEASNGEREAALALLAYPCQSLAECRAKAEYLTHEPGGRLIRETMNDEGHWNAFLASFMNAA